MRSHPCGVITLEQLDQEVTFCGWVHRRRDHGGVIFIDLRDHTGLVQVVFDPDRAETFARAEEVLMNLCYVSQGVCGIARKALSTLTW